MTPPDRTSTPSGETIQDAAAGLGPGVDLPALAGAAAGRSAPTATTLYLTAPEGIRAWAERRYSSLIREALAGAGDSAARGQLRAGGGRPGADASAPRPELNPNYTFDRFVIGEGNRLAHAAALAVAEAPSEAYNPLFLHGPPGLGKTHLLVAIANYLRANAPGLSVRYTTAESLHQRVRRRAAHAAGAEGFKRRYRDLDVLLDRRRPVPRGQARTPRRSSSTPSTPSTRAAASSSSPPTASRASSRPSPRACATASSGA